MYLCHIRVLHTEIYICIYGIWGSSLLGAENDYEYDANVMHILVLTRHFLEYFVTRHLLGGGGIKRYQPVTPEPIAAARRARRRWKTLRETLLMNA